MTHTARTVSLLAAVFRASYLWQDPESEEYKKPKSVSAATYCGCLFQWVERQLDDKSLFPSCEYRSIPARRTTLTVGW